MNDNFPYLKEEDGGFAIYINDEKVDWYDNEADAEGVALCMIDENPFTEEDFERPVDDESLFESVLKDAHYGPGMYTGSSKYYTGLPYKDCYCEIVECPGVQASDGIGEGSGRESAIFRHYYEGVIGRGSNENGEFIVEYDGDVEQLIRGIWRVAQIERNDNGVTNKNMFYDYIGADWKDICKVNAALNAIVSGKKENKPWSQEKADDINEMFKNKEIKIVNK